LKTDHLATLPGIPVAGALVQNKYAPAEFSSAELASAEEHYMYTDIENNKI
jgi:NaMN:DMB phosphoribosyltransferase